MSGIIRVFYLRFVIVCLKFFSIISNFYLPLYIIFSDFTVCPGSSDPFYIANLLYKIGHYFLDILYDMSLKDTLFLGAKLRYDRVCPSVPH